MKITCQICAREIKANTGVIAHHGYMRPGDGYQTPSCIGARRLPYQKSCDALPDAIKSVQSYIDGTKKAIDRWMTNPPATVEKRKLWVGAETRIYNRPEGFNAAACMKMHSFMNTQQYELEFNNTVYHWQRDIVFAERDLVRLQERLDKWSTLTEEERV